MAEVRLQGLAKSFPRSAREGGALTAVSEVSLHVTAGEFLTLIGPSGSGKTTLLRLIAGLERPDTGVVRIGGRDQAGIPAGDRDVAMVFQTLALYPHLTARENLAFGLRIRKTPRREMDQRVGEAAERLGIVDCLSRRPAELSNGQRQRVALGRALVRRPKVLLLDEPFASLDAPLRRELRREVQRLHGELGLTVLLVTHDQAEALALGQRVAVMDSGRLVQTASPEELKSQPASEFVSRFMDLRVV